jgi:hypothetical protein
MAKMSAFAADHRLDFPCFRKTPRAHEALNRRDRQLSSRLRHLLLLIDRSDAASCGLRQSLMTQENLDALLSLSLIEPVEPAVTAQPALIIATEIATEAVVTETVAALRVLSEALVPSQPDDMDLASMSTATLMADFAQALAQAESQAQPAEQAPSQVQPVQQMAEIQLLMVQSLRQACGLLAAGLLREIEAAQSIEQLHRCQGRWKMTLLDSRFDRGQIDEWLAQVSASIRSY